MKLSETLYNKAQSLLAQSTEYNAVKMLKSAGFSEEAARAEVAQIEMEKAAAASMVAAGIDYDKALEMVKAAGIKIKDMANFKPEPTFEEQLAAAFMKAAEDAFQLESEYEDAIKQSSELVEKVAGLEAQLEHQVENTPIPAEITKLAQSGEFTNEDLEALMRLPSETLTKVATVQEQPWKMGKAAGAAKEGHGDPLLDFLMS